MSTLPRNRLLAWVLAIAAVLWTFGMLLAYAAVAFSDDIAHFINGLFGESPELTSWISSAGAWLEQWGAWLLGVVWGLGMIALLLMGIFAHRLIRWFSSLRAQPNFGN